MDIANEFKNRLRDLASQTYTQGKYTFTGFHGPLTLSNYYAIEKELSYVPSAIYGGYENFERGIVVFGNEDFIGYHLEPPICALLIEPTSPKFAAKLNHRDYMGAILNLGISKEMLGDIIVKDNFAYIFCMEKITDYIIENLTRIASTNVSCKISDIKTLSINPNLESLLINVPSLRLDAVLSSLLKLSRKDASSLIASEKVFINGRLIINKHYDLSLNDGLAIRGYGRYMFKEISHETKKGRLMINFLKYI